MGVAAGPFSPTWVRSSESITASGSSTPVSASARAPALATSHAIAGDQRDLMSHSRYYTGGALHDSRLDSRAAANGRRAVARPRHHRRARAGRHAGNTEAGVRPARGA